MPCQITGACQHNLICHSVLYDGWTLRRRRQTVCTYPGQRTIDCRADKPLRCSCGKRWFICNKVVVVRVQIGSRLGRRELMRSCRWLCKSNACQNVGSKCSSRRTITEYAHICHLMGAYCTGLLECM